MDTPRLKYCINYTSCVAHWGCPRRWDGHKRTMAEWRDVVMVPARKWECFKVKPLDNGAGI